ncbi:polysaccharide deacetylase family protein [Streptomyces coffeae]|uniref:Polysaccharide deacetylase family protein n=1 Tax=Streptomyces coffeae TaxID=621382 RepID=A0ABS1NH47_9ACTN|nr:polysaccharide deacetylase family protein [Streptomyces coffeae]MBL1099368.1 polysaccharide deacetylase family protein [Streptomyces coffeae]
MMIKNGFSRYLVLAAAAAVFTGCGSLDGPLARTAEDAGQATASSTSPSAERSPSARPVPPGSQGASGAPSLPPAAPAGIPGAYHRWGLDRPLDKPPPAPAAKPLLAPVEPSGEGLPPVIRRVRTNDRVVFLTIDDGIEKDPRFVEQARDLGLPFTGFLTDNVIGDHYDYFDELQRLGNSMGNHTLTHPSLAGRDYDSQRQEICGQQENLRNHLGRQPRLFRPPYGAYDDTTLRAAADCGAQTVVLWRAEMEPGGLAYRSGGSLQPGDIVLAHFRGPEQLEGKSMTDMITELVRSIQEQGFTVARLEDYV